MTEYRAWFKSATGQRVTADEIANILDVSRATATRRLMEGLDAGDTITVTRALRANPVQALVDLGHLTHAEALDFLDGEGQLVETADDGFLALALAKRLNPISKLSEIDDLAARRSSAPTPGVQPLTDDEEAAIIEEANQLRSAAHPRTPRLDEPEDP